jgi:hypothetical protein
MSWSFLEKVGDEAAKDGPVDNRKIGVAGDAAGAGAAADDAIIKKSKKAPSDDSNHDLDHSRMIIVS